MKSVELCVSLVMCNSDFLIMGCSARKRDKLYVGKCIVLTISLRWMFGLCTFDSLYSLDERGFVDFNIDLVLLGMLLFSIWILMFCAIVLIGSLLSFLYALSEKRFSIFFLYNLMCS